MKLNDLFPNTLQRIGLSLGLRVRMEDGRLTVGRLMPEGVKAAMPRPLWALRLSAGSSFCRAVVRSGLLTHRQMVHAALRYRLGRSRDDAVIYWQTDRLGQVHDGKLMWYGADCHRLKSRNATWVSYLLRRQAGLPQDSFQPSHVFFGLHLLSDTGLKNPVVCIVEAEKSAVILSEHYPQCVWLAAGGLYELQPHKFMPLRHCRVMLFPDTDPEVKAYREWYGAAQRVMRSFFWPKDNPVYVSDYLELHATAEQKQRKIDLVDFLFNV